LCADATASKEDVDLYVQVCGFKKNDTIPPLFYFANSQPLFGCMFSDITWPVKPVASLVHIGQMIEILKPFQRSAKISKRAFMKKVEVTERGIEFEMNQEIYEQDTLIAKGTSSLLILQKKKNNKISSRRNKRFAHCKRN